MPQPDPHAHLTHLASQALSREVTWPTGPGYEVLDQMRLAIRTRFPAHMATEYGIDVTDDVQARAVFATLEWVAETIHNAHSNNVDSPLGVVIQGLVAASHAVAPTITGQETP